MLHSSLKKPLLIAAAVMATLTGARAQLPAQFTLESQYTPPVKNQATMGTCWAFATTTIFEVSLLQEGLVTLADWPNPGQENDSLLSMWHLATAAGHVTHPDPDYTPSTGWQYPGWGGFNQYSVGYWTRGSGLWTAPDSVSTFAIGGGPVLTTANPLNEFPLERVNNYTILTADPDAIPPLPTTIPPAQQQQAFRLVQAINFNYSGTLATYIDTVKQAIVDYGALSVGINATNLPSSGTSAYMAKVNTGTSEVYVYHDVDPSSVDHQVTIVGWDDDIEYSDWGKGAWLVQNSWGTSFGQDGYFYIPYESSTEYLQPMAVKTGAAIYDQTVLQNQIFAPVYTTDFRGRGAGNTNSVMAASKMTALSDRELRAIGLWAAYDDMMVDITIYDRWMEDEDAVVLLNMTDVELSNTGYLEITLTEAIQLALNQEIYIVVDFGDNFEAPVAVDPQSLQLLGISDFSDLSWIWGSDGSLSWIDLATGMPPGDEGIFFMKGMTAVPEPSTALLLLPGLGALIFLRRRTRNSASV